MTTFPEAPPPAPGLAPARLAAICESGRFVVHHRNRPIGDERAILSVDHRGHLRLRATTQVAVNTFALRQEVDAGFDALLRPEWCIVSATINSRNVDMEIEVDRDAARLRARSPEGERATSFVLRHPPLLIPDNCFMAHALAALTALRGVSRAFTALPPGDDLEVAAPGSGRVLLGGRVFPPPSIGLRLGADLDEHAWIEGGWVERLMVPQAQMRVDWIRDQGATA